MRLCLVEDLAVAGLEPLTLTRPVYELWLGCSNLGTKIATAFGIGEGPQQRGGVVRSHLVPVQHQRDPHVVVNDRDWLARGSVIVANGRWVPPRGASSRLIPMVPGSAFAAVSRRAPWSDQRTLWHSTLIPSILGSTRSPPGILVSMWAESG